MALVAMEVPLEWSHVWFMKPERIGFWLAAEELMREIDALLARVRSRAPNTAHQLERACESVLFNIGEGVAAFQPKVKINAYEIAKKEANEVRAQLRRLVLKREITQHEIDRPNNLAGAVIGMLTNAIITISKRIDSG